MAGKRKVVELDTIHRLTGTLQQADKLLKWEPYRLAQLLRHIPEEQAAFAKNCSNVLTV